MIEKKNYRCIVFILSILFLISCFNRSIEGNDLSTIGFYSSPKEIIRRLENRKNGYREHFMLGLAYKEEKNYKKSIFHFANSCFRYKRNKKLKLYPYPVYRFVKGFHFKSEFFDDAVYKIAEQFYLYREFEYVIKFVGLLGNKKTALYRDAILLKSKTSIDLKRYKEAISSLRDILDIYEDIGSKSIIHIRIASVYERMDNYDDAFKEYLKVIKLNKRSWQSSVSLNRILEIVPKSHYSPDIDEELLISEALYYGSRYNESLFYLEILSGKKISMENRLSVFTYLVKNYIRIRKIHKADALIDSFIKNLFLYRKLLNVKADELWSVRRRSDAVSIYKALVGKKNDIVSKRALKRIGLYALEKKQKGFERYLTRYINRYPDDVTTEYFLWLLAKEQLRRKNFSSSKNYLESAVLRFPAGRYSDRVRFWLYKIYGMERRLDDADRVLKGLITQNPGSSYTWILLERIMEKYKLEKLQKDFNSSLKKKDKHGTLFYHTLLFITEKDLRRRNMRLKRIFAEWGNEYGQFEEEIDGLNIESKYGDRLKDVQRYFVIGYMDAIMNELGLLPDDREVIKDKYLALSYYGQKYKNYYLSAQYTLKLLRYYNLKENISLISLTAIKRLLPLAFQGCVQENCAKFKVEKKLVYSVMKAESFFNHRAVSSAGAVGLMQLMPRTAKGIARELKIKRYDLKKPCTSITFGIKYLAWLKRLFNGNFVDMIGGYNAGAGNIIKWKSNLKLCDPDLFVELLPFEETRFYILRIRKFLFQYRLINGI